jgi:uncharacterized membrane protein YkvA (DUF1232 family)
LAKKPDAGDQNHHVPAGRPGITDKAAGPLPPGVISPRLSTHIAGMPKPIPEHCLSWQSRSRIGLRRGIGPHNPAHAASGSSWQWRSRNRYCTMTCRPAGWPDPVPSFTVKGQDMSQSFDDTGFWTKAANFAKAAGREVIEKALWLYFAAQRPDTPLWAKTAIYGALAYFVMPFDAIPDIVPLAGYTDDLATLAAALASVAMYVDDDVKKQAETRLSDWFD